MSYSSLLPSSHLLPFPSLFSIPKPHNPRTPTSLSLSLSNHHQPPPNNDDDDDAKRYPNLLNLSATAVIVSAALPQPPAHAKPKSKKPSASPAALSPDEARSWAQGIPVVADKIPYSDVLELKREGKVKHVVKLAAAALRRRPEPVLVVMADDTVWRTVLPPEYGDARFWGEWDELGIGSLCVNAYTPPTKKPEIPAPYLGVFAKALEFALSKVRAKPRTRRAVELEQARRELQRRRKTEVERVRLQREMVERAARAAKKAEERRRRKEARLAEQEQSMRQARRDYQKMALVWANMAQDQTTAYLLGFAFFGLFYYFVVYRYKKQKKDFEDRLKIEKAEAEERKKMRELEKELAGIEEDGDEVDGEGGERNPYSKIMKFVRSGARVRRARSRRLPQYLERGADVKFSDVAGLGKIRVELEEIVKFFTLGEMYRRRGVKIPGGILLSGPPGVGKTLLAKAVAGEAGVNFFSISASQFVEIYVGVGASRVRALYQEAKENAPSVVFIDELDAVGRERGLIKGSGGQERDATLNQLLVCLDGFEGRGEVITIAATNRPDILDPALVRPGRFDRKIQIPKPGLIGRIEILQVHARKKPMAEDVDYMAVASMTEGMVGAELANIVEIAAINMMRDGRSEITTDDLLQAAQIEERGMLDRKERSAEMWKQLALNEAAMAVVATNFPDLRNIQFVTIAPRAGRELGYVRVKMDHMKFTTGMLSRQSLLDHITVQLAPRAADEIWYGKEQMSTIWAETADNARSAARSYVLSGLSEKHYGLSRFWISSRIKEIDLEASRILDLCYERAKQILQENFRLMNAVVDQLIQKKSLSKEEFFSLVKSHGSIQALPPSITDVRFSYEKQLPERVMNQKEAAGRGTRT